VNCRSTPTRRQRRGPVVITISSAKRDMCIAQSTRDRVSSTNRRSHRIERVAIGRVGRVLSQFASRRWERVPASAAAPSGDSSALARPSAKRPRSRAGPSRNHRRADDARTSGVAPVCRWVSRRKSGAGMFKRPRRPAHAVEKRPSGVPYRFHRWCRGHRK